LGTIVPMLQLPFKEQAPAVLQLCRRHSQELGHVELVSNGVAMLNNDPDKPGQPATMQRSPP
jgi:hypothetical protein